MNTDTDDNLTPSGLPRPEPRTAPGATPTPTPTSPPRPPSFSFRHFRLLAGMRQRVERHKNINVHTGLPESGKRNAAGAKDARRAADHKIGRR